ncbi:engulfment and cell motility ELM family protein [Tieghemostelium lacteum]|uniref:glutathione gamma-glutamylcysteinyltransferase n=1 Tax=Tieghemostelium lacteum TaxID=361077 RepID=A0A151ZHV7_TIELA|nr:engulfment and cell motility ELM family protein [Tieghemostelium lacteum]|eukprot:KYQ93581.1 engulfment and cell motility ELM family protein [Tieghemostelium lacteum]
MSVNTFYKRPLPDTCIDFSSVVGQQIFAESLLEGNLKIYFKLSPYFHTQQEPAFCGISTLCMTLNALSIDPMRQWKGVWRWFSEEMLDCCTSLDIIKIKGITIQEFSCIAACNGVNAQIYYGDSSNVTQFRDQLKSTCQNPDNDGVLVSSYDRSVLSQTGTGHFSCIGGYNQQRDMALIMDVARFKYPPHWVSVDLLFKAMNTIDSDSKKSRGFIILKKKESFQKDNINCGIYFKVLATGKLNWETLINNLITPLSDIISNTSTIDEFLTKFINPLILNNLFGYFTTNSNITNDIIEHNNNSSNNNNGCINNNNHYFNIISNEIENTRLFKLIKPQLDIQIQDKIEIVCIILFSILDFLDQSKSTSNKHACSDKSTCSCKGCFTCNSCKLTGLFPSINEKPQFQKDLIELLSEPYQLKQQHLTNEIEYIKNIFKNLYQFCCNNKPSS